jgi:SAM-dependent methyltransferase
VTESVDDPFDRYSKFIGNRAGVPDNVVRLRHQYRAFISHNWDLFRGARVLDIPSGYGFWSFAALDAGATHLVGLESSRTAVEAARRAFVAQSIDPNSYQFVNSEISAALRGLEPRSFDLALCHGFLERSDPRFVFQQFARLEVKSVILDTRIVSGKGPIVRFSVRSGDVPSGRYRNITISPNPELIAFLCDYFKFSLRQVDWHQMGIMDWAGVIDYKNDHRRTYVLDRISSGE